MPESWSKLAETITASDGDVEADLPVQLGDQGFARYELLSRLGVGGMGRVELCHDHVIGRDVALKVLRDDLAEHPGRVLRFVQEARVQGRLEHPAVVPVYDLAVVGGTPYFTMKHVRGQTLGALLSGPSSEARRRRLLAVLRTVCLAVDYAHQRGVIHRDLKPENVMVGDFGEVYVLDWGVARVSNSDPGEDSTAQAPRDAQPEPAGRRVPLESGQRTAVSRSNDERISFAPGEAPRTHHGELVGTPQYMAPEQFEGHVSSRSDVYALGALLFEILAGEPLRPSGSLALVAQRASEPPPGLPDTSPELAELTRRALALDPELRLQTARELASGIERYLDGHRDAELRRARAAAHSQNALRLLAPDGGELADADRTEAGREILTALALDSDNQAARDALLRLLATPPVDVPEEVRRATENAGHELSRRHSGGGAVALALVALTLPLIPLFGQLRDWWTYGTLQGLLVVALYCAVRGSLRRGWSFNYIRTAFFLVLAALVLGSRVFGSLLVTPVLFLACVVGFGMHPQRGFRVACLWQLAVSFVVVIVLQETGVWGARHQVTATGLRFDYSMFVPQHSLLSHWVATLLPLLIVVLVSWMIHRTTGILDELQLRQQLLRWQLEVLLPTRERASTSSAPPAPRAEPSEHASGAD